ncbi:MAG: hypothetical protein EHM57_01450, partial [Actinobacteria bacterium]
MADLDTRLVIDEPVEPEDAEPGPKRRRRGWRFAGIMAAVILGIVVYAYGFEKTDVDLTEIQSETRQTQLFRILRALARPELFTYESVETNLDTQFMSPCPDGGFTPPAADTANPYIVVEPTCVEPGGELTVSGFGLGVNARGGLFYIADSGATIRLGDFQTGDDGTFTTVVDTRERASDQPQTIRAVTSVSVGSIFNWVRVPTGEIDPETGEEIVVTSPRWSATAIDTWDKIIETVFIALIATTVGTIVAVPLSFFAARNLMRDIRVPMTALTVGTLAGVIGVAVGFLLARFAGWLADALIENPFLVVLGLGVIAGLMLIGLRWAFPGEEVDEPPSSAVRLGRFAVMAGAAVAGIVAVFLVAHLMETVGTWLSDRMGAFGFLGLFAASLGEIAALMTGFLAVLATGLLFLFLGSQIGARMGTRLPPRWIRPVNVILAALTGATVFVLIAQGLAWLYEWTSPAVTLWWPAAMGAILAGGAALFFGHKAVNTGLSAYYVARTLFNGIRAIEPLIMVIVFVVWVGLGPFAGSIALALHTVASLAKL